MLDAQTFLTRILPSNSVDTLFQLQPCYYMVGLREGAAPQSIPFIHINDADSICRQLTGYNTYIAPASYKDSRLGRKAVNVKEIKSLWLDIDVGKEHNSYPTLQDAARAFANFIQATGCQPSIIVSSGAGLQAYWTFTKAIQPDAWKQFAHVFAVFCGQQNLIIDPACTEDAARIMRMPGTVHLKSGNTAKVLFDSGTDWDPKELLMLIGRQLAPDTVLAPQSRAPMPANKDIQRAAAQTGVTQPLKAKGEGIVTGCECVREAGLGAEPQWFGMMGVMRSCVDGLEWAHKISAMDPERYNYNNTEQKFYHAAENMPTRCERFESLTPDICARCPYHGKITSPIQLGLPNQNIQKPAGQKTPPVIQTGDHLIIPDKFDYALEGLGDGEFRVTDAGIIQCKSVCADNGVWTTTEHVLTTSALYYSHSVVSNDGDAPRRTHWFKAKHRNGRSEDVPFVVQKDMTIANIMRWFQEANIFPVDSSTPPQVFMSFMTAYLQRVTEGNIELPSYKAFGWNEVFDQNLKEKVPGFVTGPGIVTESGLSDVSHGGVSERIAREEMTHKGALEEWKKVPRMYRVLGQKSAQLAICMALAAPFMKYCPGIANNAVYSLWSNRSSKGKTNVIEACASIWGHPSKQLIQRLSSPVLRQRKLSTMKNLPVYLDELTDVPDEEMFSLAYTLIEGKEKQKLRSNGAEMVETGDWQTVTFVTANRSFKSAAARMGGDSDASVVRVMEIECNYPDYTGTAVQDYINDCIEIRKQNYGVAGPEFMYQVLKRADRLKTLNKRVAEWVAKNGFTSAERYMSAPLGMALIIGRWAVEFGILDFDMDELEAYALGVFLTHNREETARLVTRHDNTMLTYLMEHQLNTLIVAAHDRPADMPPAAKGAPDKYIDLYPQREAYIRIERADSKMYIALSDLDKWCKNRRSSAAVLTQSLRDIGIPTSREKASITRGIPWCMTPAVECVVLDLQLIKDKIGYDIY